MRGKHLIRALALSLLVAVGVVAVSASAAQAKWVLKRTGVSVLQLKLIGSALLSELLVPELEIGIHCAGGNITETLTLNGTHTVLSQSASSTLTSCKLREFEKVCTVESPGAGAGSLALGYSGQLKMEGEKTFALVSNEQFVQVKFTGALCPLAETLWTEPGMTINGSLLVNINSPQTEQKVHLVEIDDDGLFIGEEQVILDGELLEPGTHADSAVVHMQEESGNTWAVQLSGL